MKKKFTFNKKFQPVKTKLFFLFFIFVSVSAFSQEYIFGKTSSEFGEELGNTIIINTRTDEKVLSDKNGNYMIAAKLSDELRFVKNGYERSSVKIAPENYSKPLNILLEKSAYLIEEIELAFNPTGNLKKDVKSLNPPKKVVALNSSMDSYMKTPPTEVAPKLTTPSSFKQRDFTEGTGNILGVITAITGLIKKATTEPLTKANYAETQEFYRRIKNTMDLSFYTKYGFDEEEIDRFLIYADQSYELARKYRKNFDIAKIDEAMKLAFKEYIKTRKTKG